MSSKKIVSLVDTSRHVLFGKKANNRQQLGNATKVNRAHAAHKDYGVAIFAVRSSCLVHLTDIPLSIFGVS